MKFPSTQDFLEKFGIAPIEEDPSLAYCRYVKTSSSIEEMEVDISFSAVSDSFQVILRIKGKDVAIISSERTELVEIFKESAGSGIRAVFDLQGVTSEAIINLEPELTCRWWTLRTE